MIIGFCVLVLCRDHETHCLANTMFTNDTIPLIMTNLFGLNGFQVSTTSSIIHDILDSISIIHYQNERSQQS